MSQYTQNINYMSYKHKKNKEEQNKNKKKNKNKINKEFKDLGNTLSNIKHSSDEWKLMSSVNIRPPNQRAAAPLEKNLIDLFIQFT